jgi:LPS sulfotransferase NodH
MKTKNLDSEYMNALDDISFDPIFIMGLHRSGTSILYKMLGASGHFNTVTAYHILEYDNLLYNHVNNLERKVTDDLARLFKSKGITNRRIDHLPITPDFEQEYVYLFTERNCGNTLSSKNLNLFENLCKKIQYILENNKPILLKNPYDFPNFIFIKKMFPNARFVFIHRDPVEVISSTMRAWQTLLKNKNPYTALFSHAYDQTFNNPFLLWASRFYYSSPFPLGIFSVINRSYHATRYFLENINWLEKESYVSITYRDLCKEPNGVMTNIMNFLKLKTDVDFREFIKPRKLSIIPEVQQMEKFVSKKMEAYNQVFGFNK